MSYLNFFIGMPMIVAFATLVLAKYLPKLLKFIQLDHKVVQIAQGLMVAYGIIFGVLNPIAVLITYAAHYVLPF